MSTGVIGKKVGMTSVFAPDGRMLAVTVVQIGPCVVTQVKKKATDGYDALQLGFGEKKSSRLNKPLRGHVEKSGASPAVLKEFRLENADSYQVGEEIDLSAFVPGKKVSVSGNIKGRGFSGVIKRHGFSGGRKTHGSKSHRIPGSIGCSAYPSRVMRGKRLPGRYGNTRQTVKNLEIVDIRPDENLLLLKGAVPGAKDSILELRVSV